MLFKRRDKPSTAENLRVCLWPRRSWARSVNYILLRVNRLSGSPHAIALGCAAGIFVSYTPIMGFHFIAAATIAYLIGGNLLASALGTFFGNPLTFPFIWASAFKFGHWILGNEAQDFRIADLLDILSHGFFYALDHAYELYMKPMMIGGIPLGFVFAFFGYFIIRKLVENYQTRRLAHLTKRASQLVSKVPDGESYS